MELILNDNREACSDCVIESDMEDHEQEGAIAKDALDRGLDAETLDRRSDGGSVLGLLSIKYKSA